MTNKILLFSLLALLLVSCEDEVQEPANILPPVTGKTSDDRPGGIHEETNNLVEADYAQRANRGLSKLMTLCEEAAQSIEGYSNPSYTIDERCNVVYAYEENGSKYEKRFNMGDLAHAGGKMSLQADDGIEILYPGFRMETSTGDDLIEVYKDGSLEKKENNWYLTLADRAAVEKAVPNMVNVINVCRKLKREQSN